MRRRRGLLACAAALAALAAGCGGGEDSGPVTLNWWAYNEPSGSFKAAAENCTKAANGRYEIAFNALGNDPNTQRQQLVRRLAAGDSSIDMMSMDVPWTAEFAEAKWIKPLPDDVRRRVSEGTLQGPLETATYKGKLYGAPANSNTQLLWYRKDLVDEVPKTWDELIAAAEKLDEGGKVEVQGAAYEGFTVWFNSLVESAGGKILKNPTTVALGEPAKRAAEIMARLAKSDAANPSLANIKEDQARQAFEGGSAFQVNYPFIWPSAAEVTEPKDFQSRIGWAPYPRVDAGTPSKAPIGGFNWGVSEFTKNPEEAFAAIECLRNEENQRAFANDGGLPPTLEKVYDDPKFQKEYPFADLIRRQLDDAGVRPVTPAYADVSLAIYSTLSPASGITDSSVDDLTQILKDALQSKGLI